MRRQLIHVVIEVPCRLFKRNRNDLVVDLVLVDHTHHADRIAVHLNQRIERLGAQHKHIQRIAVIRIGARNEAIIGRIMRGCIQNAVQPQQTGLFVQFILFLAACRDLDHRGEPFRRDAARINVVPDVSHAVLLLSLSIFSISDPPTARKTRSPWKKVLYFTGFYTKRIVPTQKCSIIVVY